MWACVGVGFIASAGHHQVRAVDTEVVSVRIDHPVAIPGHFGLRGIEEDLHGLTLYGQCECYSAGKEE